MYSTLWALPRECHIAFDACFESYWSGIKSFMELSFTKQHLGENGQWELLGTNFKELKEVWGSGF